MSTVAILKTNPQTVLADYERLLKLARAGTGLSRNYPTILKDNISWHLPFPGANTTPWQLEGVIRALTGQGFKDLTAVSNNTVVTDPVKGGRLNRLTPVYREYNIPVLYNFRPDQITWKHYQPQGELMALDRIYQKGIWLPEFFIHKNIVHLPTVKCHIYTTTTGAMKNAFGGLLNTDRHLTHSVIHQVLVDLLMIQQEIHPGRLAVMDGTTAGNGPGPRTMKPVQKDVILASTDMVAIDAVAARLMGFDPLQDIPYIRLAHEKGLGTGDIRQIDIQGDRDCLAENWQFSVGFNFASYFGRLFWFSPFKILQKLLFQTPMVNLFILASYIYHDWLWWPLKGKSRQRAFLQDNPWGKLFQKY
jgi:uncharacterized protein (DUF362 family)